MYVPSAYHYDLEKDGRLTAIRPEPGFPATVAASKRLSDEAPAPVSVLFSPEAEFGESLLMEINRGCGRGCREVSDAHSRLREYRTRALANSIQSTG